MKGIDNLNSGGASTLTGLSDVNITTPSNGDILEYDNNSGEWKNRACYFAVVNGELCQVYDDGN